MPDCELIKECPFYNKPPGDTPQANEVLKHLYCHKDNSKCAIYLIASEFNFSKVPAEILPNQGEMAKMIIEELKMFEE
jgi:hypothetical protein